MIVAYAALDVGALSLSMFTPNVEHLYEQVFETKYLLVGIRGPLPTASIPRLQCKKANGQRTASKG